MEKYYIEQEFLDIRTNTLCTIVDIRYFKRYTKKGPLYTVQYGDLEYRRYYEPKFEANFKPTINRGAKGNLKQEAFKSLILKNRVPSTTKPLKRRGDPSEAFISPIDKLSQPEATLKASKYTKVNIEIELKPKCTNVVYVNFFAKGRIVDRKTWLWMYTSGLMLPTKRAV